MWKLFVINNWYKIKTQTLTTTYEIINKMFSANSVKVQIIAYFKFEFICMLIDLIITFIRLKSI